MSWSKEVVTRHIAAIESKAASHEEVGVVTIWSILLSYTAQATRLHISQAM